MAAAIRVADLVVTPTGRRAVVVRLVDEGRGFEGFVEVAYTLARLGRRELGTVHERLLTRIGIVRARRR